MAAAVPFILSGLSTASTIQQGRDARKNQNEQREQQDRMIAEERANTPQNERGAVDAYRRRRRGSAPGFSDAGAATLTAGSGYGNTALGQ